MKLRIRETYLIFLIVIGLVSLSLYTTYAMFTATTTIEDVVDFDTSLSLNTSLSEYELITLTGNETQVIEVNVTNSYDSTLCYGIWYEVVSGEESSLDIGTFTEKNTTLPSGQITSGSTITAVVGMSNGSSSSITLKLGTIGRETSGSSCSLGITSPRSLIGTEWADVILVTDEYLSEHKMTTTTTENYSWSSSTSGSTTLSLEAGTYKLEVWGAQGGTGSTNIAGGKGGYSYGTLTLSEEITVYAYVGGQGTAGGSTSSIKTGGFNGGGNSGYYRGGSGGGGSDIRIGADSIYARVIVAGGGGGGSSYGNLTGGAGGGTSGIAGTGYTGYTSAGLSYSGSRAKGGSSTSGGDAGGTTSTGSDGIFWQGGAASTNSSSYNRSGGGGGGWYGGGGGGFAAQTSNTDYYVGVSGGGGGSGYVYTSSTVSNYPSNWSLLKSNYYLTDAATIAGNKSFTDYDGTTVTGHSGDGAIKITGTITKGNYSIPTLDGLSDLTITLGQNVDFTEDIELVCEGGGTTGCSILEYPNLNTSTLEVGSYTVYYVLKGSDNKKYKYARNLEVKTCIPEDTLKEFEADSEIQTYTISCPGTYKLQVWGSIGAEEYEYEDDSYDNCDFTLRGGYGGYSYGTITLTEATTLYVNAGGSTRKASDIRIGTDSLYARVIVAGGGGSYSYKTYSNACADYTYGGAGGGTTGGTSGHELCWLGSSDSDEKYCYKYGEAGTQISAGLSYSGYYSYWDCHYYGTSSYCGLNGTTDASFGYGDSGAGDGWYGGGSGGSGGAGGSGWVYTANNYNTWCSGNSTDCANWLLNDKYYLTNAYTTSGNNPRLGKARITYLG